MLKYKVIIITNKTMTDEEFIKLKGREIKIHYDELKEGNEVTAVCEGDNLPVLIGTIEKLTSTKDGDYLEIVTTKNIWTLERID